MFHLTVHGAKPFVSLLTASAALTALTETVGAWTGKIKIQNSATKSQVTLLTPNSRKVEHHPIVILTTRPFFFLFATPRNLLEGGGLGEGRNTGLRAKKGREEMKSAARPSQSHRSLTISGWDGRDRRRGGRGCGVSLCMRSRGSPVLYGLCTGIC